MREASEGLECPGCVSDREFLALARVTTGHDIISGPRALSQAFQRASAFKNFRVTFGFRLNPILGKSRARHIIPIGLNRFAVCGKTNF